MTRLRLSMGLCIAVAWLGSGLLEARTRPSSTVAAPSGGVRELVVLGTNARGYREYRNPRDGSILIAIPAGTFQMGSASRADTRPRHLVRLAAYAIGRHEVTNAQFARFVKATGYRPQGRWSDYCERGGERHPAVHVSWFDARAYCAWAHLRLPYESEWERAARGTDGRDYPWGNAWDPNRCSNLGMDRPDLVRRMLSMDRRRGTVPVGSIPAGASPCGALDMLGNASEWCLSQSRPYPCRDQDGRNDFSSGGERVIRGGCWFSASETLTCWARERSMGDYLYFYQYAGFRVARSL